MKAKPTRGPISTSSTHHAREAVNSRHSFSRSHLHALLCERKKDLFECGRGGALGTSECGQFVERALPAYFSGTQKDKAIADARGIGDLVNRKEQGAARVSMRAKNGRDLSRLPQIKTLKGLVSQQHRLRREESNRQQRTLALALRERADWRPHQRRQRESIGDLTHHIHTTAKKSDTEIECPFNGLGGPGGDRVRQIEKGLGA